MEEGEERIKMVKAHATAVAEISWETCNKVGGIYTVIASKASHMLQYYQDYFLIGPYFKDKAAYEFEELDEPEHLKNIFEDLRREGIFCYYGKWLIKGEPKVVLVDHRGLMPRKDEFKAWFWEKFAIDTMHSGFDFEEPLVWSWAVGRLLEELKNRIYTNTSFITHHHEWLSGLSLLYLKGMGNTASTVFTTHATMLGRSIAGNGKDLYAMLDNLDAAKEAYALGVQDKFLTEKATALAADVFTTVSEITALEAEKVFGKRPEVLVLNGFEASRFPTIEETSIKHVTAREALREFQSYYFFPHYHNFDLSHNMMMCTSGRYEFGNKGMDVFVDALARLNEQLKQEGGPRTVTVFFWVPMATKGVRTSLLENKNYYRHIKGYVEWHSKEILKTLVQDFITSTDPVKDTFYTGEFMHQMKQDVLHFKRAGDPPISTHILEYADTDPLYNRLLQAGLDNRADDKVKVVVYPVYLDGNDGLLNMPYYEALAGTHLAVFPSYYEPWGYTPLEAAALGVPTVTTDVAGFGRFVEQKVFGENPGAFVIKRYKKEYPDVVQELYDTLLYFTHLDHTERVAHKINVKQLSQLADWSHMVKNYIKAHNLALK